jgi:DNA-binding CsgD family transcriptional regulator
MLKLPLEACFSRIAEIADQLGLSAKTVETYRARGMEKLGLRTRAALVRYAFKSGLISGE